MWSLGNIGNAGNGSGLGFATGRRQSRVAGPGLFTPPHPAIGDVRRAVSGRPTQDGAPSKTRFYPCPAGGTECAP